MDVLCTLVITAFLSVPVREDLRGLLFGVIHPFRPLVRDADQLRRGTLLRRFSVPPVVWSPT